ncbi:MAG TPA: hypothetical protein VGH34_13410 [Vicinamibacterales bacterium]|jgi:hypothetical protein
MKAVSRYVVLTCASLGAALAGTATTSRAQTPPPVNGVTGTVALEGTVKKEYAAAHTIVVMTIDGVEHVFQFTKDLIVHGGKHPVDSLPGLREGATVVIHYTVAGSVQSAQEIDAVGDEGLKTSEGTVARIDRSRKQITIRFDNGKTESFQLTERAAADAGQDINQAGVGATKVIVYYSDEHGQKVAHFFRKTGGTE